MAGMKKQMTMGASSGFSSMMDGQRSTGLSSYGNQPSGGMSSRMDYGRGDTGRGGGGGQGGGGQGAGMMSGDMKTRADKSTVVVKNVSSFRVSIIPYTILTSIGKRGFNKI